MTTLRFLTGVALAILSFGSIGLGARQLRRRVLPTSASPEGALATFVLAASAIVVASEILGTIGVFNLAGVTFGFVAAGALLWSVGRTRTATPQEPMGALREPRWFAVASGFAVALTVGNWIIRTVAVQRGDSPGIDTVWYHLPTAARFAQTGHLGSLHYLDLDPATAYFPANSELPHALGMVLFGSDVMSPLINLGWMLLALCAAWCIGRRLHVGHLTLVGMVALLATPMMTSSQPGVALNDIVGIALLGCAMALALPESRLKRTLANDVVLALIVGLSIGTKFTFVIPSLLFVIFLVADAPAGRRVRRLTAMAGAIVLTGGYWFVRNLVTIGNPLPSTGFGPLALPRVTGTLPTSTFAQRMFDVSTWHQFFIPGIIDQLTYAVILIGIAFITAILFGIRRRATRTVRWMSFWTIGSLIGFIATPQYLENRGIPVYFVVNFRYIAPAVLIALMTLPLALPKWRTEIFVAYVAVAVACQVDSQVWPTIRWHVTGTVPTTVGALAAVAIFLGWAARSLTARSPQMISIRKLSVTGLVIMIALTASLNHAASTTRFAAGPMLRSMRTWADGAHPRRVVVAPSMFWVLPSSVHQESIEQDRQLLIAQYPLYGSRLSNHVQMAVLRDGDHLSPPKTCDAWLSFLRSQRATDVVSMSASRDSPEHRHLNTWTAALPGARVVLDIPVSGSKVGSHLFITSIDPTRIPMSC